MMWRAPDGSLTIAFWYAAVLSTMFVAAGIWSLTAPESLRVHYFNVLNSRRRDRGVRLLTPKDAWGWSSPIHIRIGRRIHHLDRVLHSPRGRLLARNEYRAL